MGAKDISVIVTQFSKNYWWNNFTWYQKNNSRFNYSSDPFAVFKDCSSTIFWRMNSAPNEYRWLAKSSQDYWIIHELVCILIANVLNKSEPRNKHVWETHHKSLELIRRCNRSLVRLRRQFQNFESTKVRYKQTSYYIKYHRIWENFVAMYYLL